MFRSCLSYFLGLPQQVVPRLCCTLLPSSILQAARPGVARYGTSSSPVAARGLAHHNLLWIGESITKK